MWRINLFVAFFAVRFSNSIQVLIITLNPDRINGHPALKLINIRRLIFGKIHIHKTRHAMPIRRKSNIPILIMISINSLLVKFSLEFLRAKALPSKVHRLPSREVVSDPLLLLCVVFVYLVQVLLMFLFFVLEFSRVDLFAVCFLELMVLFHYLVLVAVVNVDVDYLFALLYGLVFLFQA